MHTITVFRDAAGWFWALQQDGAEVIARSPTYTTKSLAVDHARTAQQVAAQARIQVDDAYDEEVPSA
jgi:uncharacterized protein YegP (UPF0339 family)